MEGEINNTVTGLFPYGRYALTPRLGLWATAGYGWGQLFLKPDGMEESTSPAPPWPWVLWAWMGCFGMGAVRASP